MKLQLESYARTDPRLRVLAAELGCCRRAALGLLCEVWWDTQEARLTEVDRAWLEVLIEPNRRWKGGGSRKQIVDALITANYIETAASGKLIIRGNQKHVAALSAAQLKAKAAAEARWSKQNTPVDNHAPSIARASEPSNAQAMLTQTQTHTLCMNEANASRRQLRSRRARGPSAGDPSDQVGGDGGDGETDGRIGPPRRLAEIWNAHRGTLPKVTLPVTSKGRVAKARLRWAERPDENYWRDVVTRVAGSAFCCGAGSQNWRASFDWLITNDRNHEKVMEGHYDNAPRVSGGALSALDAWAAEGATS